MPGAGPCWEVLSFHLLDTADLWWAGWSQAGIWGSGWQEMGLGEVVQLLLHAWVSAPAVWRSSELRIVQ